MRFRLAIPGNTLGFGLPQTAEQPVDDVPLLAFHRSQLLAELNRCRRNGRVERQIKALI
jgi:hypothetical protein